MNALRSSFAPIFVFFCVAVLTFLFAQVSGVSAQTDTSTFDFECGGTFDASIDRAAFQSQCEALPGRFEAERGGIQCYTYTVHTCKLLDVLKPKTAQAASGSPTPAADAASCTNKPGTKYECVSCGPPPFQLSCATSAGCNAGTTGACVSIAKSGGGTTVPPGGGGTTIPPGGSGTTCAGNMLCNPLTVDSIEELVLTIIDVILVFLLPVIILYIMYAGYLFVTAQGNPGELTAAKKALLTALIGGVIILGARAILDVVKGTIEAVTGEAVALDTTPVPKSGGGTPSGGSGSGGGSPSNTPTIDTTFSNYSVGRWTGSGVGKVPTTETMPISNSPQYYTKACSVCYADFNTLATGINRCAGKDLPVGTESFESMCTRYKGSSRVSSENIIYTVGDERYVKYLCWVNPSITTDCSATSNHSYYQ